MTPEVLDYSDYREYLRDYLAAKRAQGRGFTARQFCLRARLGTEDYLLRVLRGRRNLGARAADKFIEALPLKGSQAQYFRALVMAQSPAATLHERSRYLAEAETLRRRARRPVPVTDNTLFRRWYVIAILELASCKGFVLTANSAAENLSPKISVQEAKEAIELLVARGLLVEREGRLVSTNAPLKSTDGVTNAIVRLNHRETVQAALDTIDLPIEQRGFYGLTIAVDRKRLPELKARLKSLIDDLQAEYASDSNADSVYRINAHCFPMAALGDNESS